MKKLLKAVILVAFWTIMAIGYMQDDESTNLKNDSDVKTYDVDESKPVEEKVEENDKKKDSKKEKPKKDDSKKEDDSKNATYTENISIYKSNGIEFVFGEYKKDKYFSYEIKNESDQDILFSLGSVAVNGCITSNAATNYPITPGNRVVEKYEFYGIEPYNIDIVESLDIYGIIYENKGVSIIDEFVYHIDLTGDCNFEYTPNATKFYEDDYISAYSVQDGSDYDELHIIYYNKTDDIIVAGLREVSINGVMLNFANVKQSSYILPGCYAHTGSDNGTVTIYDPVEQDIKDKELGPIEHVEGKVFIWGDNFANSYLDNENVTVVE